VSATPPPSDSADATDDDPRVAVLVWDLPIRIFHWVILLLLVAQLATGLAAGQWMDWHLPMGYAVLALVIFRILWGFFGSTHARFASFLAGPRAAMSFAKRLFSRQAVPQVGHNPLGGWSVIAIILSLAVQGVTGLFANDGVASEGPLAALVTADLSHQLSRVHRWNVDVLLVLSGLHVLAVLYHWLVKREDLIGAMFTGVKRVPASILRQRRSGPRAGPPRRVASRESPAGQFPSNWRAAALMAAAVAIVYALVRSSQ
jgi:cytochrome b